MAAPLRVDFLKIDVLRTAGVSVFRTFPFCSQEFSFQLRQKWEYFLYQLFEKEYGN